MVQPLSLRRPLALTFVAAIITAGCGSERTEDLGTVVQALGSGYRLPFRCGLSTTVTQGNQSSFSHNGVAAYGFDFGVALNTPLVATKAGRVAFVKSDVKPGNPCFSGGGSSCANTLNYVVIDHGDGTSTAYLHMNAVSVAVGQQVAQGKEIGLSGGTGWSTGPHTHLQRQKNCGIWYCQSVPMSFDDVVGAGVPTAGQAVRSDNSCTTPPRTDCSLGDGLYCGGNGTTGDSSTLFQCTGGASKAVMPCANGCKRMPAGTDDRCAVAEEAPAPSGAPPVEGAAAGAPATHGDEAEEATPSSASSPSAPGAKGYPGASPVSSEAPSEGCSASGRDAGGSWTFLACALGAAILLARRRRP